MSPLDASSTDCYSVADQVPCEAGSEMETSMQRVNQGVPDGQRQSREEKDVPCSRVLEKSVCNAVSTGLG